MKEKKTRKKLSKEGYSALIMLVPCVVFLIVCSIYPIIWTIRWVPYNYNGVKSTFTGWANFKRLFTDSLFWNSVLHTFEYAFYKIIFIIPLALLVTVLLQQKLIGSSLFRGIYFMPTIISTAIAGMIFTFLFSTNNGVVNAVFLKLGWLKEPARWLSTQSLVMIPVTVLAIWGGFGNYMLYFTTGMSSIDTQVYEAAKIDGATQSQTFFRVTLPMMAPTLKVVLQLALLSAFKDYEAIMVLTQGGPANRSMTMFLNNYYTIFGTMVGNEVISQPQIGYGALCSLVAALIVGLVTIVYLRVSKRLDDVV
ncbi:MAG: sugar ABC transporter permease [Lachnospiraceae bacterium]|nr:sugar ABC transporter permease [Lachnospiraceae bacterium]